MFDFSRARSQHTCIKGETGSGKTALAANMAIQDIAQDTQILVLDPHGDPYASESKRGLAVQIYTRCHSVDRIAFLSLNQKDKAIGYNHLFHLVALDKKATLQEKFEKLGLVKDELMNSIFYDQNESLNSGFQVPNTAKLVFESILYFHNIYLDWLLIEQRMNLAQAQAILQVRQITFNDLAALETNPELVNSHLAPGNMDVKTKTTCEGNQSLNIK